MLRIGILGAADIAIRKFLPALSLIDRVEFGGVAVASKGEKQIISDGYITNNNEFDIDSINKGKKIVDQYGGKLYKGYQELINSDDIDAIYIPLPPAIHYYWGKEALLAGKHVLMEKPFTINYLTTMELIELAKAKGLVVLENFGFTYHRQFTAIKKIIEDELIGDIKLITSRFGFPFRSANDFRYFKKYGGGALFDCGCYTIRAAQMFLDNEIKILGASLSSLSGYDVDGFGIIQLKDNSGRFAQLGFGMNNQYQCNLEIWGTKGIVRSDRFFTAPSDKDIEIMLERGNEKETLIIDKDDQFKRIIEMFVCLINERQNSRDILDNILLTSNIIQQVMDCCDSN